MRQSASLVRAMLGLLLVLASVGLVAPRARGQELPGRYIVVFQDNVADPAAVAAELGRARGLTINHVYQYALKGFSATIPDAALDALQRNPQVAFIESDQYAEAFDHITDPTGIGRMDADHNGTAAIDGGGGAIGVGVAVIDTGSGPHSDLNVAGGTDCTGSGYYDDDNGHGPHVAGTIGAFDDGGNGIVGVAPGAPIYSVKVLNADGSGSSSSIICGVDWVTANVGTIQVANMSLGGRSILRESDSCGSSALHRAICNSVNAGVTYAVAAGNSSADSNRYFPATYNEVITVSALADFDGQPLGEAAATCRSDVDDTFADFSNYGADVDIAAPGVCIRSTWLGDGENTISSTSMATPHVAGAAALYIAAGIASSPAAVKDALLSGKEPGPIAGDPDSYAEGIVNVNDDWSPTGSTGSDTTAPTGEITAPTDGSTVSGSVTVTSSSTDSGSGVASAKFQYSTAGTSSWTDIGTDTDGTDGYAVTWDTIALADGDHDLQVTTTDNEGNSYTSTPVTVTVQNATATDTTPPAVSLTYPTGNEILSGTATFSATADDGLEGSGVASVTFQASADGGTTWFNLGTSVDTTSPYSLNVDTTALADGTYMVQGVATDNSDNTGSSATVAVTVENMADPSPAAPTAPSDLTASTKGRGIRLDWVDNSTDEEGFYVYRSLDGAAWEPPVIVAAGTTTYRDVQTSAGVMYYYAVSAFNAAGESNWSDIVSVTEE